MKNLPDEIWKSPDPEGPAVAVAEKPAAEPQPVEAVTAETERQLADQGWCLWRCSVLNGDVIVVARDELVTGYPAGYPVYTVQELDELHGANEGMIRMAHEIKKVTPAVVTSGGKP